LWYGEHTAHSTGVRQQKWKNTFETKKTQLIRAIADLTKMIHQLEKQLKGKKVIKMDITVLRGC
ncbi:hypothetical protein scyTo_0021467, partial [Scyliorhinus torazame]|nr:hypothetical protein [Scyliorhinus torazame]